MQRYHHGPDLDASLPARLADAVPPGRMTLTQRLVRAGGPVPTVDVAPLDPVALATRHHAQDQGMAEAMGFAPESVPIVQRHGDAHTGLDDAAIATHAARGVAGSGHALPHLDAIQRAFGPHDVTGVRAHVGGAAAAASLAIGAHAYATGNDVAFAAPPDLFLAAHEAAHVVQQRQGVHLSSAVGQVGDPYEQHADAVAMAVVRGESAAALLGAGAEGARGVALVQRKETPKVVVETSWAAEPRPFRLADHKPQVVPGTVKPDTASLLEASTRGGVLPEVEEAERLAKEDPRHPLPVVELATGAALAWAQLGIDVTAIYGAWNEGVGNFKQLMGEVDQGTMKQLRDQEDWKRPEGFKGNLLDLAESQVVASTRDAALTVGDLGNQAISAGDRQLLEDAAGEEVRPSAGEARAPVREAYQKVRQADTDLTSAVQDAAGAAHGLQKALHERKAVILGRQLSAAQSAAQDAAQQKARLEADKAFWLSAVGGVFKAVEFGLGGYVTGAAAIAAMPPTIDQWTTPPPKEPAEFSPEGTAAKAKAAGAGIAKDTATAIGGNAAHDVVGMIAEGLVSLAFKSRMDAADAAISKAEADIAKLSGEIQAEKEGAAREGVGEKFHALESARVRVIGAKQAVSAAYSELATAIRGSNAAHASDAAPAAAPSALAGIPLVGGLFGGGTAKPVDASSQESAAKMAGIIAAIPIARSVVGRLTNTLAQMQLPHPTDISFQGYAEWARIESSWGRHNYAITADLHGKTQYAQGLVQEEIDLWQSRLASMEEELAVVQGGIRR